VTAPGSVVTAPAGLDPCLAPRGEAPRMVWNRRVYGVEISRPWPEPWPFRWPRQLARPRRDQGRAGPIAQRLTPETCRPLALSKVVSGVIAAWLTPYRRPERADLFSSSDQDWGDGGLPGGGGRRQYEPQPAEDP